MVVGSTDRVNNKKKENSTNLRVAFARWRCRGGGRLLARQQRRGRQPTARVGGGPVTLGLQGSSSLLATTTRRLDNQQQQHE